MSDPQIQALVDQVNSISVQIQTESSARAAADDVLKSRIGALEAVHSGSTQSKNYVSGVSGWKLNNDGTFEINSCILGSAAKAPERQMVSVEVASWSKYDLPRNAANLLQFMQAELQKVPEQYRHAAEFEELDASYGDESFNSRLFLSYARLETEEELADRLEKAKVSGTRASIKNGLLTVSHDGVLRYKIGNLDQPEPEQSEPFKVDGDQIYISDSFLADGSITSLKLADNWSVKVETTSSGQKYAASFGLGFGLQVDPSGVSSQFIVSADRFAVNGRDASEILEMLAGKISKTALGKDLKGKIDLLGSNLADQVKALIRKELMPGGLLHRSR